MEKYPIHPLKIYCLEHNLSQKQMAEQIGITANWLSFIMNYRKEPHIKLVRKISEMTGIPVSNFYLEKEFAECNVTKNSNVTSLNFK